MRSPPNDLRMRLARTGLQVDAPRRAVEVIGEAAEIRAQPGDVLRREVGTGLDPEPGHLLRPARADAVEPAHRQPGDECAPWPGLITQMPSGLFWSLASLARNLL